MRFLWFCACLAFGYVILLPLPVSTMWRSGLAWGVGVPLFFATAAVWDRRRGRDFFI